ncbi:MAG: glycine cleavage system protein GcvH [Deltaproteobacteria bacterium]|nr:glycine cleavage system protein GcvH [Deltaproteobacteria bacterium]
MTCPDDLKYTSDHEWVRIEGANATVGITHFAQAELGDLVFVELPAIGRAVSKKETFCVVESTKAASDVYAPLGGKVAEVNQDLNSNPELINQDPYNGGWIAKLEGIDEAEAAELLSAAQYREIIGE